MSVSQLKIISRLAEDLADPESEISRFADEFFLKFLMERIPGGQADAKMSEWEQLESEEEQERWLNEIEEDFMFKFEAALTQQLKELVVSS